MSYYIIIRGPLGIGKSTIAQELAKKLDADYVPIDIVLEKHTLDNLDKDEECIPVTNFIKVDEIIIPKIKEKLKKGKRVIFDACFYHKEHIEHLIQNLPYPHYIFTLKAPLEVCIERDGKREKSHGRDAAIAVYKLVSKFNYGIVIDTKKRDVRQTVKEILSYLKESDQ